jgi:dimethylargininase
MLALTHTPSPAMDQGLRTFAGDERVDLELALRQHAEYEAMLKRLGARVRRLEVNRALPDGAFIEDTAVVLDEAAVLATMGAAARRAEPAAIEPVLREYREVHRLPPGATLEGGDVLRVGRELFVGLTARTNEAGARSLAAIAGRFGYRVRAVAVRDCLHFKSACCALPDGRLLVNPAWIVAGGLDGCRCVHVPADEPWGAQVLALGETVCMALGHARTAELIASLGFAVETIDLSEFAKVEGGVTCLSILVND